MHSSHKRNSPSRDKWEVVFFASWFLFGVIFLTGCASLSLTPIELSEDEKGRLIRARWWNYYERGKKRLAEGRIEAAKADFKLCIDGKGYIQAAEPNDFWKPRTYGMHYHVNYFPNRELGYCYYISEPPDYLKALKYFNNSTNSTPSDRANRYINACQSVLLTNKKVPPPEITVNTPLWTRKRELEVKGKVISQGFIKSVSFNNEIERIRGAQRQWNFLEKVKLTEGKNILQISAENLKNEKTNKQFVLYADWQNPVFVFSSLESNNGENVLRGYCVDDQGLVSVEINGKEQLQENTISSTRKLSLKIPVSGNENYALVARDKAGNEVQLSMNKVLEAFPIKFPENSKSIPDIFEPKQRTRNISGTSSLRSPSSQRLEITFASGKTSETVYADTFYLDGTVKSVNKINSVLVREQESLPTGLKGNRFTHFRALLKLEMGINKVPIDVEVEGKNPVRKWYTLIRKEPEYKSQVYSLHPVLSPLGFNKESREWNERLFQAFQRKEEPRFTFLSADKILWQKLLAEHRINLSNLSDDFYRLKAKFREADYVFIASLYNDVGGITIRVEAINLLFPDYVQFSSDVFIADTDKDTTILLNGLASKIERYLPETSARVINVKKNVRIDKGEEDGLHPHTRCIVVQAGKNGLEDGKVLQTTEGFMEYLIESVSATQSQGKMLTHNNLPEDAGLHIVVR